ncbi:MAG: hypothetical protein ACOCU1_01160 [Bacillota bacterium]
MYQLDIIKQTALAKKLGGLPIFNDGFLHSISLNKDVLIMDIKLLAQNNPLLTSDSRVLLKLYNVISYNLTSTTHKEALAIIYNIDIRKEENHLRLLLESTLGDMNEIVFESIELEPA